MGVSFKISRTGTRLKPKPVIPDSTPINDVAENSLESSKILSKNESNGKNDDTAGLSDSSLSYGRHRISAEDEVSFILNLYSDGYSIGKPSENDNGFHAAFHDGSKLLHPYDRTSEGLFAAVESGWLPGGILDDIPCKYVEGSLICEVRDYRKCTSDFGSNIPSVNGTPTITKVCLKMSLENVVKDISSMAEDSWTYGDLMEVESRILKALKPKLCLDPTPRLDRLSENPVSSKLNLGLVGVRKRRLRQMPEVTVTSNNHPHGKKICIDRAPESSNCRVGELGPTSGDVMSQNVQDNLAAQGIIGPNNMLGSRLRNFVQDASFPALDSTSQLSKFQAGPRNIQGPLPNVPGNSPSGQDMPISYSENISYNSTLNKKARLGSVGPDDVQQQQIGSYSGGLQMGDVQWRNQLLQQQSNARGIQYNNNNNNNNIGMQKYPQLVGEGIANLDNVKLEKADTNLFMRPAFQQGGWNNLGQQVEKDPRKEDQFQKRKSIQSPRVSTGNVAQSPISAKSADMSCGSMGTPYGAVSSAPPLGHLQREKSAVTSSIPAVGRTTSMTSSANDSMQQLHQAQLAAKRRSNSVPKTSAIQGVGSPASVNNMGGPMNASSPSISTPQLADQIMLERFSKIEVVAMRHQLNCKKNKVDEFPRKPRAFSAKGLVDCLSSAVNNEYVKDETCTRPMSKSLIGGSMNVCKLRVLTVRPERTIQGNMIPGVRTRMIMSEKPNDGTVAMHYGDLEDLDYMNAEDDLPTLPNTHLADLLAAQFCALMIREGYFVEDHVQPRPPRVSKTANSQPNSASVGPTNSTVDTQQYSDSISAQQNETKPTITNNATLNPNPNIVPNSGMLPPGNPQALQMSQGLVSGVSRPQQMDPQLPPQQQQQLPLQQQQQQTQFQRSPLMLPTNSMPQMNAYGQSSNLPLGNHMGTKASPLQIMQQQQHQQQQRRMMMGLGPAGMGMGNIGNMVGLGGLGNVMGIGGQRGMGGAGMSGPMGPISGIGGNMGQNAMSISQANAISQHLRAGTLTQQQAQAAIVAQRFKVMQSRGMLSGTQPGLAGLTGGGGARQMQPGGSTGLSMLGPTLNRGNMSPMQRTAMGQMGMPKLMTGMNVPMTQQQFQLQQQQQQQQSQPHQQQQEATSPLQAVVSPQQVGSPSTMVIQQPINQQVTPQQQQQQASPQQMAQRTPMSPPLSSGPMHPMSAGGNQEACPASPALSSQTLGSVGSISNSPMDLQGVNKSNSMTNT